jgi:hypothetical protein
MEQLGSLYSTCLEYKSLVTVRQKLQAVSMKILTNLYVAELIWVEISFKEKV